MDMQISLGTKYQLKLTTLIFWTKFNKKRLFRPKTEGVNTTIEFCIVELVSVPNFSLNWQFCFFGPNFPKKVLSVENRKSQLYHWIVDIRISLGTKIQLKQTILIFWTKFTQKGYPWWKTEKMNITIEFCIFELVWVSNFSVNWQFWFFRTTCPKRGFLV